MSAGQDDRKLIPAVTAAGVKLFPDGREYDPPDFLKRPVPFRMAECVIIFLEIIEVEQDKGQLSILPLCPDHLFIQLAVEIPAVEKACQVIGDGELFQLPILFSNLLLRLYQIGDIS